MDCENNLNGIKYKIIGFFDRILTDEKFIVFKCLILEVKKKSYKRTKCFNDSADLTKIKNKNEKNLYILRIESFLLFKILYIKYLIIY